MSAPISIDPKCTIKAWYGDHQLSVKVSCGKAKGTYLINIKEAEERYPEITQMEAVKRTALDRFREPNPSLFTGYE
jgi:hypothetical protein